MQGQERENTVSEASAKPTKPSTQIGLGIVAVGLVGCDIVRTHVEQVTGNTRATYAPLPRTPETEKARFVLNRVAFGAKPGEVAKVTKMGVQAYLEEQLADTLTEDPLVNWRVNTLDLQEEVRSAPENTADLSNEQLLQETAQASLLRAVYSRHQLRETMADFWTNHFNIFALKNNERELIPVDTETVIRPHILSSFRDLLLASAHSPAMLSYLDNQENKRGVANENYARELLELHTLGVHSGYTQKDIQEVARCFTGWRLRTSGDFQMNFIEGVKTPYKAFLFDANLHDEGAKFIPFLNLSLSPKGGEKDADAVLERLATHEATARFLAQKLCRRYLGYVPNEIVERATKAYLKNDTSIRALLRPILLDGLKLEATKRPLFKRPLDFVVSALRTLGADTDGGVEIQHALQDMGQPLYQWPMPDGFPEKGAAWTGSLLARWNFALSLLSQRGGGTHVTLTPLFEGFGAKSETEKIDALLEGILNQAHDSPTLQPLRKGILAHIQKAKSAGVSEAQSLAEGAALVLASPPFQWK